MAMQNNDYGRVGLNAALEMAEKVARRNEPEIEPDQPVDFAALARFARNVKTSESVQPTQPAVSHRTTQTIICPEPNA